MAAVLDYEGTPEYTLCCVITDKDVVLRDGRVLSGHETMPFYIRKGATV